MKKSDSSLGRRTIIWAGICILLLLVAPFIFIYYSLIAFFPSFNPYKHVCEGWDAVYCRITPNGSLDQSDCRPSEKYSTCSKWRDKNECELDATSEGCICDKWSYTKKINQDYLDKCCKHNPNGGSFICFTLNSSHWVTDILCESEDNMFYESKDSCISAHPANECEKGNPEWRWEKEWKEVVITYANESDVLSEDHKILDSSIYDVTYHLVRDGKYQVDIDAFRKDYTIINSEYTIGDYLYKFYLDNGFKIDYLTAKKQVLEKESICRQKTIEDYNCEELWEKQGYNPYGKKILNVVILKEYIDRCGGDGR